MTDTQAELLRLTEELLRGIDEQDWDTYTRLCAPNLTAFEPEARGHLVEGLPFHHFYFELPGRGSTRRSSISSPRVDVYGETAVVTCVRLVQIGEPNQSPRTLAFEETRVWHRREDRWVHVHFHRSVPAAE